MTFSNLCSLFFPPVIGGLGVLWALTCNNYWINAFSKVIKYTIRKMTFVLLNYGLYTATITSSYFEAPTTLINSFNGLWHRCGLTVAISLVIYEPSSSSLRQKVAACTLVKLIAKETLRSWVKRSAQFGTAACGHVEERRHVENGRNLNYTFGSTDLPTCRRSWEPPTWLEQSPRCRHLGLRYNGGLCNFGN